MKLLGNIQVIELLILVDSGNSRSFISCRGHPLPHPHFKFRPPLWCPPSALRGPSTLSQFHYNINEGSSSSSQFDMVLGMDDRLESFSHMVH